MVHFTPFQSLTEEELALVLEWRNHPEVRKWMNTKECISLDQHLQFVSELRRESKRAAFLVTEASRNIGVIQLNNIQGRNVFDVGMYTNPALIKSGAGLRLGFYGAQYLFKEMNFDSLFFMALRENEGAQTLWRVLGIKPLSKAQEGLMLGQLHRDDFLGRPQDYRTFVRSV